MNFATTRMLPLVVISLFLCLLVSGIFVPIYSDEVVSKWSASRFFLEGHNLVSLYPQCTTMSDRAVSPIFYPAALLISTVYANLSPLGIRVSGIVLALTWFALLAFWCFKQTGDKTTAIQRLAGLIGLSALGIMPYLWILSRSEQFLTLPLLIFCVTALYFKEIKSAGLQCAGALLLIVTLSCFFYMHPKSLFFLPFLLAALWLATASYHKLVRLALLSYAVILFAQVLHESNAIAACTDAPAIQSILAANTLLPKMLFSAPTEFIDAAYQNLINFPERLLRHLTFNATSQSGWLPPIEESTGFTLFVNFLIKYCFYALVVGVHLASLLTFIVQIIKRKFSAPIIMAALLAAADILNIAFFNVQHFYSGVQFVPLSIILTALLFQNVDISKSYGRWGIGYSVISVVSITSMIVFLLSVTPATIKNSSSSTATLPGQPLSIPVFNTQSHLKSIEELGASCGLTPGNAGNMVLDHMTYFAFLKEKKPIHVLYVSEIGYGGDLTHGRLLPFLRKLESPGIITRCEWIPNEFRKAQKSNDMGYCCVNFNDL
ncbi:hypothetical protein [Pseudomonas purpurea]|uniref:hypothetical protein n=1 Tax=Pseudomonas purpurea TaxID=3136737 RepID=UPI0032634376